MKKYQHILVPIDFTAHCEKIMVEALSIQQLHQSQLTLVHCVEPLPSTCYGDIARQVEEGMEKTALSRMAVFADRYHILRQNTRIEVSHPKNCIPRLVKTLKIDLLIIGSHPQFSLSPRSKMCQIAYRSPCDVYAMHDTDEPKTKTCPVRSTIPKKQRFSALLQKL